jgi:hypothetical protein
MRTATSVARSRVLNLSKRREEVEGGYAVMAVGYLSDRNLSDDFWAIRVSAEGQG